MSFKLGANVLSAQAGYPKGHFQGSYDPAMGRGYRGGNQVVIPAGADQLVVNHGTLDGFFRWKVSLYVQTPVGVTLLADTAYYVEVTVTGKNENDEIPRTTQIEVNNGQVIYVPGRSLEVRALNPTLLDLELHYSLDEATPGLSSWQTGGVVTSTAGVAQDLPVPAFANSFQIFGVTGGAGWRIRGYDLNGNLVYSQVLVVPMSGYVPIVPGLRYTIEVAVGAGIRCMVLYQCLG